MLKINLKIKKNSSHQGVGPLSSWLYHAGSQPPLGQWLWKLTLSIFNPLLTLPSIAPSYSPFAQLYFLHCIYTWDYVLCLLPPDRLVLWRQDTSSVLLNAVSPVLNKYTLAKWQDCRAMKEGSTFMVLWRFWSERSTDVIVPQNQSNTHILVKALLPYETNLWNLRASF